MTSQPTTPRILYVDDDRLARSAFSIQFKRFGYGVDMAASAAEALKMVESESYSVVITDLRMPGMGGLELVERLRAVAPDTAVIVVTGLPELDLGRDSFHDEAILAVHPKPWNVEALKVEIERGLHYNQVRTSWDLASVRHAVVIVPDAGLAEVIARELDADQFVVDPPSQSVESALATIEKHQPVLIVAEISALHAPRFNALSQLREVSPSSAILVITDERSEVIARQSLDRGVVDYCFAAEVQARSFHRAVRYAVERRETELQVAELQRRDSLTGLLSHTAFRGAVAHEVAAGGPVGVALIGLERLNTINDSLGHDAGDTFLREVGKRLSAVLEHSALGRVGSDVFAVMVRGVETSDAMVECGNKLLRLLRDVIKLNGIEITPMASVGVTISRASSLDADTLVRQAGVAMRFAKQGGRSRVHLFTESHPAVPSRLSLETELRGALEQGRYVLHYQPQRDLKTGAVRGAEALLRMVRSDGKLVPPCEFIPVLEDTDLIVDVGAWVLQEACRKVAEWHRAGHRDTCVAVNLSARQFEREGLVQIVLDAASEAGIEPSALELEITESLLMRDTELANATLRGLKQIGTRIAIDDFGTGYSSLSYFNRFAVDVVKIDRSFVSTIGKEVSGGSIASAIIGLGHRLGLQVVGEGIETTEELAFLRSEGCDAVQGFLLGRPAAIWSPPPPRCEVEQVASSMLVR